MNETAPMPPIATNHAANTPVIINGPDWKWETIGKPVPVSEPPGPFLTNHDREEQVWWMCILGNALALVAIYREDMKQRQRAAEVLSLARCEMERVFGHKTTRALYELSLVNARQHPSDLSLGLEIILWAQTLLAVRVILQAYTTCQVRGAGRRMVEAMDRHVCRAIQNAFPSDMAAELIEMKAIHKESE